ncbi:DUF397 domain-containing protein [Micromonospora sp. SCSIO 07396]
MAELNRLIWRKSSRSSDQGNCVEVADNLSAVVGVRDSKDIAGPVLVFSVSSWRNFLSVVRQAD